MCSDFSLNLVHKGSICIYVWSSGCHSCSWSAEQGKLIFPCPRACLRIWSRETGSAVPPRVSLLISILRLNLVLTYGIPPEFRGGVYILHVQKNQNAAQIGRLSPADHERDRPPCTSTQNVRSKLSLQLMVTCRMLRRSRCIQIFFKQQQQKALWHLSPCVGCSEGLDAFRFTKTTAL